LGYCQWQGYANTSFYPTYLFRFFDSVAQVNHSSDFDKKSVIFDEWRNILPAEASLRNYTNFYNLKIFLLPRKHRNKK
jgi:hypothetical protein